MSTPTDPTSSNEDRPMSRREAREAAANATRPNPQVDPAAAPPGADPGARPAAAPRRPDAASETSRSDDTTPVPAPAGPAPAVPKAAGSSVRSPGADVPLEAASAVGPTTSAEVPAASRPGTTTAVGGAGVHPPVTQPAPAAQPQDAMLTMADLFAPEPAAPRKRRKRGVGRWIAWILVFALVIGGGYVGYRMVMATWGPQILKAVGLGEPEDFEAGKEGAEVDIVIKPNDTGLAISQTLYEANVTKTPNVFYDHIRTLKPQPEFYPGVYTMRKTMTAKAAAAALADPANKREQTLLIKEGATAKSTYANLATALGVPVEQVLQAAENPKKYGVDASSLEGWLFPATYQFDKGTTPEQAIQKLVNRMRQSLDEQGVAEKDRQRILTIASIIQREGRTDDFAKVSRVIMNRLRPGNTDTHGKLQMDSTAQYGVGKLEEGTVATTEETRKDDNPYNTYVHAGLPAGPIASPGDDAIKAAMHPADGPWLYFVTINLKTGETVFSATYAEQLAAEKRWHQWCQENPDSGCY